MRDRVRDRYDAFEPKLATVITAQHTSAIGSSDISIRVLHIVETSRVSLPHIYFCIRYRLPRCIEHPARHKQRLTLLVMRQHLAMRHVIRVVRVEWA